MGKSCTIMSNAPDAPSGQQDFIKGWPHPSMIDREPLKAGLSESYAKSIAEHAVSCLNYGTKEQGAFMLGHPVFLEALGGYLSAEYGQDVPAANLMSTGGASMATDIACRIHAAYGACVVSEAPTYYLGHNMFKERGLRLREVPIQQDGMDMDALEEVLKEEGGKVKLVYTIPVHHNPTGITMCNEKRVRLVALAKQYDFKILADEAYQLVSFTDSGNNPVIFNSCGLAHFISSGALKEHITFVNAELCRKKYVLVAALTEVGLEPYNPNGGYFVWVQSKGKMTGRSGKGMTLDPPNQFEDYMRLCFAWLTEEQIKVGVEAGLRQE